MPTQEATKPESTTYVVIQQPALPHYRIAPFEALASRPGVHLRVVYGQVSGGPDNVAPEGFEAVSSPLRTLRICRSRFYWHAAQVRFATPKRSDVLVLSWNIRYLSLVPALLRARWHRLPTILWGHGYSKAERGWRQWLRHRVAKLATALLLYGESTAQGLIDAGWPRERVYVALNSLDQRPIEQARQRWLSDGGALDSFRKRQGLSNGPCVLFVSRLEPANRLDLLVEAAAMLKHKYPRLQIVIIGKGEEQKAKLRSLATSLGIDERVRMLGAIYDENEIAPWFLNADIFCYPANIGLSILHAFGYGLPVITSDRFESHNPEIEALKPGVNGLTYRHGDAESLASVLDELLDNPAKREELGQAARATAQKQYSIERMVAGFEKAIEYCTGRTHSNQ